MTPPRKNASAGSGIADAAAAPEPMGTGAGGPGVIDASVPMGDGNVVRFAAEASETPFDNADVISVVMVAFGK